jgi:hypothetical protein
MPTYDLLVSLDFDILQAICTKLNDEQLAIRTDILAHVKGHQRPN